MLTAATIACCVLAAPPIAERGDSDDWTITINITVERYRREVRPGDESVDTSTFHIQKTPIVFPILAEGAFFESKVEGIEATLELDDRAVDPHFSVSGDYPLGSSLGVWNIDEFNGREIELTITQRFTCYESIVRKDLAAELPWPAKWPGHVTDALKPQLFIESDDEDIKALVKRWTRGNVRSVPPYMAAKAVTGQVIEYVQRSGKDWVNDDQGRFAGFDLRGARWLLESRKGTDGDIVCFHTACLRAAGIPARPVIGMHARRKEFRMWTEFYIYDEECAEGVWLPVDIIGLRRRSSRSGPLDRQWKDFAVIKNFNEFIPLAYHFHPPTAVRNAGPPALWGWDPRPKAEPARQYLTWKVFKTPKRGGG